MKIERLRIAGIRCFEDTGPINLSPQINIFVGQNNAGKSTLLKGILSFQGFHFSFDDIRSGSTDSYVAVILSEVLNTDVLGRRGTHELIDGKINCSVLLKGSVMYEPTETVVLQIGIDEMFFASNRPKHAIVPFLAKRKTARIDQTINLEKQNQISGTFDNLYSRIDLIASSGHLDNNDFCIAVESVVGVKIATRPSQQGKEAGFYVDNDNFVPLDRMGDGVTELLALIVELCLEKNKIFVLEEPELHLHPKALKAILKLIRSSSEKRNNQFILATHSNIVVRELGSDDSTKVFKVTRDEQDYKSPSLVEEIPQETAARMDVLLDLGCEFFDMGLHDAWLFLEESSAEQIINEILIPKFVPGLKSRLRTFSAKGAEKLPLRFEEFQNLVTFIHLEPVYRNRLWIRADGEPKGQKAIADLRKNFNYLTDETCTTFTEPAFEYYYPNRFFDRAISTLNISDKSLRSKEITNLLREVIDWTFRNGAEALSSWEASAAEPIAMLRQIAISLKA